MISQPPLGDPFWTEQPPDGDFMTVQPPLGEPRITSQPPLGEPFMTEQPPDGDLAILICSEALKERERV